MTSYKQSSIFALLFFVIALIFRSYAIYRTEVDLGPISGLISCIEAAIVAGFGFYLGQLKSKENLSIKHLAFSAIFAFLMSHTISNLAGLYQISWFAYAGSVFVLSVIIAIRAPKMFNKQSTANKTLN
jgi:hypothetical protein